MILHTTIPEQLIFSNEEIKESKEMMVNYRGIPIVVERMNHDQMKICRILSTNPNDYLQTELTPGTIISLWS